MTLTWHNNVMDDQTWSSKLTESAHLLQHWCFNRVVSTQLPSSTVSLSAGACNEQVKDPLLQTVETPTIGDVSTTSRAADVVLLVGEGDFSFARSLVELHHAQILDRPLDVVSIPKFVCTSLDSESTVNERYGTTAPRNIHRLKELQAVVAHGIDATDLSSFSNIMDVLQSNLYDGRLVVIFMFPHHCGKGRIDLNRKLIHNFCCSVATIARNFEQTRRLCPTGWNKKCWWEVRITLAPGQGGTEADGKFLREWNNSWQIVDQANRTPALMVLQCAFSFNASAWANLGYGSCGRRNKGRGRFWATGGVTHVFTPQLSGVVGVCSPSWAHDFGVWCSPSQSEIELMQRGAKAVREIVTAANEGSFSGVKLTEFVSNYVGSDLLQTLPDGRILELLDVYKNKTTDGGMTSRDSQYEKLRLSFSHRLTFRICYKSNGEKALSKLAARDLQLALRDRITQEQGELGVLLT